MNEACVAISDLHFDLTPLAVAKAALRGALDEAERLNIPLVIAGDLNNTKAIIRAEVANAIIEILATARVPVYILEGNHDKINEKGQEHGLNYLRPYAKVIDKLESLDEVDPKFYALPYQNSVEQLKKYLEHIPAGSVVIMHQGVRGALMGDYKRDDTSIEPELLADFTCISGHYHKHQTIGTLTYIGSPYTITFTEATDGPKGFMVINHDGTYERRILNLRKHVIIETDIDTLNKADDAGADPFELPNPGDLIWLKVRGPYTDLEKLKKRDIGKWLFGHSNFKFDKIYTDDPRLESRTDNLTDEQVFDAVIDETDETPEQKAYLKALWREVLV